MSLGRMGLALAAGSALAVFSLGPVTAIAGEGNGNYLGVLSSTPPTGYTPSPAWYSLSQGHDLLTFQFDVTNLTGEQQSMNLQLNLDHITVYQGQDVSDGQPGVIQGAVVDGQFNEQLSTQVQDPNPTFASLAIGPNATETLQMSRSLSGLACGYYQVDVAKQGLTSQTGLIGFEIRILGCGTPSISTIPSPNQGTVGVVINDTALVTGGLSPTGTVTFALFNPGDPTCSGTNLVAGVPGFANVPLSGGSASSASFTTSEVGTYNWRATYSGDANNNPAMSTCGAEPVNVQPASPSIATTPSPNHGTVGVAISDSAAVSGGLNPTGTVSFALFGPGDPTCAGPNLVAALSGFANVPLSGGSATSAAFTTSQAGTYNWIASYSGDSNNNPASSACGAEQVVVAPPPFACSITSSIVSNFNGTAVPAGDYIWFNSVLKASGLGSSPVTITITGASITFTANGTTYTLPVPDARITYSPTATTATTTFNTGLNMWITTVPSVGPGNQFMSGFAFPIPVGGLPGGINPVTWQATINSDTHGVSVNWQWGAAAYTSFSGNLNALGVKPVDSNSQSQYLNSDHAGTPESFKLFVTGGARGGGGSNFTGSYSATKTAACP
jgi:hypothetical protein